MRRTESDNKSGNPLYTSYSTNQIPHDMGAIAGAMYPNPFQMRQLTETMLGHLKHRGSGEQTTHNYRNIQIGSFENTFFSRDRNEIVVTFDAQIANQKEIQEQLKKEGRRLVGGNLGELLAAAYVHWGTEFVTHLDGEFAIALLDQRKQQLLLYRDRLGKKPLYWFHQQRQLFFASELKALLATGAVPQTPAVDALATYLFLGYIPQDMTPILDVNKLLPGHYLQLTFDGNKRILPYWSASSHFTKLNEDSPEAIEKRLDTLLKRSTDKRVGSATSIGCFVGGGLGSAATATYLQEKKATAFTAVFEGKNSEDLAASEETARFLKLPHEHRSLSLERLLKELVPVVWYSDEPIADPNLLLTWHLCQMAKKREMEVVFSGMGADEFLGTHMRYHMSDGYSSLTRWLASLPRPLVKKVAIPLLHLVSPHLANRILRHTLTDPSAVAYLKHNALFRHREIGQIAPGLRPYFDSDVFLQKFYQMVTIKEAMASTQYIDVKTKLPDLYMAQLERLTTASGLRWETPFLSKEIVEYLAGVPDAIKGVGEESALPLRHLMKGRLPEQIANRQKVPRPNFLANWTQEPPMQEVLKLLESGSLVESGFLDGDAIRTLAITNNSFQKVFCLLVLEVWFRLYINNPISDHAPKVWVSELLRSRN